MILIHKPYRWGCLITSFAMAFDTDVVSLERQIGHDGSEIVAPYLNEPTKRRGFHIQELIRCGVDRGYSVTPYELFPVLGHPQWTKSIAAHRPDNWQSFKERLERTSGVITGGGAINAHAVAYDRGVVFDPDGYQYEYSRHECEAVHSFFTQCLWIVDRRGANETP